ncbi:MAG: 50S ribosomal protein L6 [Kiritimatiellae bacterium]|nr:50S ribosomal protein L6 [Kiritimatiellia bacterium]MCO5068160.1 50S ribosomal protein L6 [Kiritimatiellia bacterium]
MSRIGKKPVEVLKGVTLSIEGALIKGKSAAGELAVRIPAGIAVKIEGNEIVISATREDKVVNAMHGTTRSLIANMVKGLATPYVKELEIQGVGFRAQQQGQKLVLALGFSHPINFEVPAGVAAKVSDGTTITLTSVDKHLVGETAARIRSYFPAEPYKGKGVRYKGEHVRRKAGKAVA